MNKQPVDQPSESAGGRSRTVLNRSQRQLVCVVISGVAVIAALGFVGSYSAVTELAAAKGFGWFAHAFPTAVDAGVVVYLALDLLLTWLRMPYAMLRHIAWSLTAATIAFNAAAAWPDPVAVGMHATIPVLFIGATEAARHAIGRIADITADRHMENPRLTRWLLAFPSTFRIWRRQHIWELRSYEQVIAIEREAAEYREQLRAQHGRRWRKAAGRDALLAVRLARYGTPVQETLGRLRAETEGAVVAPPQGATAPATTAPSGGATAAPRGATTPATVTPSGGATAAPRGATTPATVTPSGGATAAPRGATTFAAVAPRGATASATVTPSGRPATAAVAPQSAATGTPQGAFGAPATTPPPAAPKAPRRPTRKVVGVVTREEAKASLRNLYDDLGRRPLESEMTELLDTIGSKFTSRQYANKLRAEIERAEPHLAALGQTNVTALTGTGP